MLPGGRIFAQITQNVVKICFSAEKLAACVKYSGIGKSVENETGKCFYN
jgi:hypothetical protein